MSIEHTAPQVSHAVLDNSKGVGFIDGRHDDVIKWKHFPCAGNSPVAGEFPSQKPVMRSYDFSFDMCLNKVE